MRRVIAFPCAGETLVGTLDEAAGPTGLVIVSGGNEVRSGAHRGMALLATRLAARGVPVFRYDRRGIGDSSGANRGFAGAAPDLSAAAASMRREAPHVTRLVGFGNCDAATTLALFGRASGIDAVVLANPWVVETPDDLPPPAAIRARYAERLRDRGAWLRLARGSVDFVKLWRGLRRVATRPRDDLAARVITAIAAWERDATVVLAKGDATAIAYAAAARNNAVRTITIDTDSHSFARGSDQITLEAAIVEVLTG